jgi:hypothetical protein
MMARGGLTMAKGGKPDRDWKEYNEHLVQRGEILLDVESLQGWQEELEETNLGKNGRPFRYPHSLTLFLGTLRVVFSLPYRQLEGLARRLSRRRSRCGRILIPTVVGQERCRLTSRTHRAGRSG